MGRISNAARVAVQLERARLQADSHHLPSSVVPMSGASMRILEGTMAVAAIITAVLIGLGH
ncbi:MAG TPA: hypothetical protein VGQ85_05130 [Candidatus Limnocylindrales bacterium]|nr:hypothetical protein [Candidatus Limnocylindrales bacterium]